MKAYLMTTAGRLFAVLEAAICVAAAAVSSWAWRLQLSARS